MFVLKCFIEGRIKTYQNLLSLFIFLPITTQQTRTLLYIHMWQLLSLDLSNIVCVTPNNANRGLDERNICTFCQGFNVYLITCLRNVIKSYRHLNFGNEVVTNKSWLTHYINTGYIIWTYMFAFFILTHLRIIIINYI